MEEIDISKSSFRAAEHDLSNSPLSSKTNNISFIPGKKNAESRAIEDSISSKKNKIKKWMKDPLNFSLVGVLIFAFIIRLYYFIQVGGQPLWWDELAYGSLAKNMISGLWDGTSLIITETHIRPILFPFVWSIFLRAGFSELMIRFFLEFLPSVISVFFVYLVGKEIYGKRVGIISAFIFSTFWIHLFYTVRLLTNVPALVFLFSSVYYFIMATKKEFNYSYFSVSLILLSISTLIRYPNGIIFAVYAIVLLLGRQFFITKKKFWIYGIIGFMPIIIFFIINLSIYGNIFPALLGGDYINSGENVERPIAFHLLSFIPLFLKAPFFIFFIIGIIYLLFELVLGFDLIKKNHKIKGHAIIFLILAAVYSFFIFYMRSAEDRWLFTTVLPLAIISGLGVDKIYSIIKKYNKLIGIIFILAVLLIGAQVQIKYADALIENKKTSYSQMREGFVWLRENTPDESIIAGIGTEPYIVYYSERRYIALGSEENMSAVENADYLIYHSFVKQPEWLATSLQSNTSEWEPFNAWFFDKEKTQLAMIVYMRQ